MWSIGSQKATHDAAKIKKKELKKTFVEKVTEIHQSWKVSKVLGLLESRRERPWEAHQDKFNGNDQVSDTDAEKAQANHLDRGVVQAWSAEWKVDSLTAITFNMAKEQFDTVPRKENKDRPEKQDNGKERKIKRFRIEIETLQFKLASRRKARNKRADNQPLRAAHQSKESWEDQTEAEEEGSCTSPVYKGPLSLYQIKSGGDKNLTSSKEEVEQCVEETFNDPSRDDASEGNHGLSNIHPLTTSLNTECPSWRVVQEFVRHARSAPGPSGLPY